MMQARCYDDNTGTGDDAEDIQGNIHSDSAREDRMLKRDKFLCRFLPGLPETVNGEGATQGWLGN